MRISLGFLLSGAMLALAAQSVPADPERSYEVKKELNVMVPMRDGVRLSTDVYRPDAPGRFPVILERTPYDNNSSFRAGMRYAGRGYVYVTQDVRGRYDSEGEWTPFVNEAQDGYDTQEWAGIQPWSAGKICTTGGSYVGATQWLPAPLHNKHLTCMVPQVAPPSFFKNIPYENGVPMMFGAQWMLWMQGHTMQTRGSSLLEVFSDAFYNELYDWARIKNKLPMIDIDNAAGYDSPWWDDWMRHDSNDEFWKRTDYQAHYDQIDVPVFHIAGWYDHDFPGTFMNYPGMVQQGKSELARQNQKLLITPFGHWYARQKDGRFGSMDFGPGAVLDITAQIDRWFDHWLKGIDNGIEREPPVKVFVMGANRWREAQTWPLPGTRFTEYYLHSGGHANTYRGDGTLSTKPPRGTQPPDRYSYDPADPTPSSPVLNPPVSFFGPEDLRPIHSRQDVLVFETEPLKEAVEIVGQATVKLFAASSARDTDWFVRLSDVHPNGYAMRLSHGVLRARFRESLSQPKLLEPGKVYEYTLELWATANRFLPGHRIRIDVASANFPLFGRNLNTGANNQTTAGMVKATQTIYHDAKHPSRVVLPVVPATK